MDLRPNLAGFQRIFYIAAGLGLVAWGFFVAEAAWARAALPIAGGLAIIEGIIAF